MNQTNQKTNKDEPNEPINRGFNPGAREG
jgi:hypothetical protein